MEKVGYFNYSMNILWSLSVEEVFYLTFPIICITLRKSQNILLFLCIPIVVGPIYRSFYTHNEIVALYGYLSCFDAIAFGGCAALIPPTSRLDGLWNKFIRWIAVGAIAAIHPS